MYTLNSRSSEHWTSVWCVWDFTVEQSIHSLILYMSSMRVRVDHASSISCLKSLLDCAGKLADCTSVGHQSFISSNRSWRTSRQRMHGWMIREIGARQTSNRWASRHNQGVVWDNAWGVVDTTCIPWSSSNSDTIHPPCQVPKRCMGGKTRFCWFSGCVGRRWAPWSLHLLSTIAVCNIRQ